MSIGNDCYTTPQLAHIVEAAAQAENETLALMSNDDIERARAYHAGFCAALRAVAVALGLKPTLPGVTGRVAVILATSNGRTR
jgi:hypothetical protein